MLRYCMYSFNEFPLTSVHLFGAITLTSYDTFSQSNDNNSQETDFEL